jgi:tRNA pseudouridine55 synthase
MTSGILLLDKPQGLSSNAAVQKVRRAFGRVKAGHTGSLDPLATGMLPVCLGEATKVAGYLLEGDKTYAFTLRFGQRTTTGDLEGAVAEEAPVPADLAAQLAGVLPRFRGPISQVPPMYSAIKQAGQPLYRLARQGIEVAREPRSVTIRELELLSAAGDAADLRVSCSKGTYVRTLAEDIAVAIGTVAHLTHLRREGAAPFHASPMVTLEQVEADPASLTLLPADAALQHCRALTLDAEQTRRLRMGQTIAADVGDDGLLRLYGPSAEFLGLGRGDPAGTVKPVRLFNHLGAQPT